MWRQRPVKTVLKSLVLTWKKSNIENAIFQNSGNFLLGCSFDFPRTHRLYPISLYKRMLFITLDIGHGTLNSELHEIHNMLSFVLRVLVILHLSEQSISFREIYHPTIARLKRSLPTNTHYTLQRMSRKRKIQSIQLPSEELNNDVDLTYCKEFDRKVYEACLKIPRGMLLWLTNTNCHMFHCKVRYQHIRRLPKRLVRQQHIGLLDLH